MIHVKKNNFMLLVLVFILLGVGLVSASSTSVWQGQYYTGTTFNVGTYEFNFTVYDALSGGNTCFTNTVNLTTGAFGQWTTEQTPWGNCNNASKDYFLNINIAGTDETPRKRLTVSDFLRRDVSASQEGNLIVSDNVSATYFLGDGSKLTGINGSSNSSWNQSLADTLYYGITNPYNFYNSTVLQNLSQLNDNLGNRGYTHLGNFTNNLGIGNWTLDKSNYFTQSQILSFNYYNSTDFSIGDYYLKSNPSAFWNDSYATFNKTYADTLYADISVTGDNSSWNKTLADTLYLNLSGGNSNQDINIAPYNFESANLTLTDKITFAFNEAVDNLIDGWLRVTGGINVTENAIVSGGINVTNDSYFLSDVYVSGRIRGLSPVEIEGGLNVFGDTNFNNSVSFNNSVNITGIIYGNGSQLTDVKADTIADSSVTTNSIADNNITDNKIANLSWGKLVSVPLGLDDGDNDTQKTTSGPYVYNDSTTIFFNETVLNNTIDLRATGDNSSWNQTLADTLYYSITNPFGFYNSTDFSITDYFTKSEVLGFNYYNSTDFVISDYYLNSNPSAFWNDTYATFNKTYADTLYAGIGAGSDNASWNESYADTLYYSITNPFGFYNSTDFSITDYFTKSEVLGFNYYNSTDFVISDYYLNSNPSAFWNDTYATFNKTYADTLYADISVTGDNSSWNQTLADTLYLNLSGGNSNQDINIAPYNFESANLTLTDKITFAFGDVMDNIVNTWIRVSGNFNVTQSLIVGGDATIKGNITTEEIHLEQDSINHRIYDNSTCIIIKGDTSTMFIC